MSCFWTDMVGCAEDCGNTPPAGPAMLAGVGATNNVEDIIPFAPDTGLRVIGSLQFTTVTLYRSSSDFNGCLWSGFLATTDAGLAGTTVDVVDAYGAAKGTFTWKLLSDFADLSALASATNVALGPDSDGMGGSFISFADFIAALFPSGGYDNAGFLLVGTVQDVSTGQTWEATWAADTCF